MKNVIQDRIKGMNFVYRSQMMTSNIDYINAYGSFEDEHRLKASFHLSLLVTCHSFNIV